ncbi:trafficking kinesin-binding protein milt isoform X2 [Sitodiplosis mosellana]|uniref:trafficking kinesin-binding protein milt isoform X2 n=1 Tax=Sitodiplosis mosellana TaxID=263140 RepID=UPI002444738A|nr:trafficking kinesin-binding protein milt isoform X2 [Sitodiplosis mosellana]XP_055302857.1 trafficking kinesin-binding protein milt isoform X2 [Sitodiplosis mosellana]XP_055302858.1 trafficking kinesin-binding protein milt isoform X2 [Sitodiplosis mosellana]XP_055302859.1 trafficking kinesin-binding protein milt isoform X2 [Sitodiplosis mosellana]
MSIEEATDLMDLFEYDEFDSYDDHTYQLIAESNCSTASGIPLSVELSESLSKNQTPVSEQPSICFVKAPEIFLRIDASGSRISTNSESSSENSGSHKNANKLKNCEKSNSLESIESNDVVLLTNRDECVELQYENEFVSPNDEPDCVQSPPKRHNSIENDYEELLFEVLCSNRLSQMTRVYDDIEAVTRLLEEKEKDLELTAHIGKDLLAENTRLKKQVEELENDVKVANENCIQLKYELTTKCNLLAALTNDDDAIVNEEEYTPMSLTSVNLDLLQKKVSILENENKALRNEATQLSKETDEVEEIERRLMDNIRDELSSTKDQYDHLIYELDRLKEENKTQSESIEKLTGNLAKANLQIKELTAEYDEQTTRLRITTENQNALAMELAESKARYQEVLSLLEETQKELRNQRKRQQPTVRSSLIPGIASLAYPPGESLQSELMESSLFSDHSLDSGIASDRGCGMMGTSYNQNQAYKKAFDMVRCVGKAADNQPIQLGSMSMSNSATQPRMSSFPFASGVDTTKSPSIYGNSSYPASMGSKTYSHDSLTSDSEESYPSKPIGVPGAPGSKELEAALKRLTPAEVLVRRTMLSNAPPGTYSYEEGIDGRTGFRTPDSIMSTGSSGGSLCYSSNHPWRKKLELVMPMEGSQTLHHWNRLATPTLSGLLDERPGVTIRGGRGLDELGLHLYSLSDVEEDEADHPGKQYETLGSIYTYTNSTVMHPDDGMSLTSSLPQSQMSSKINSISSSRQPSAPATPHTGLSRRNSCSTFSVSAGLASMLNERGIKAVTPSALNTPAGQNHSPTVTPCNSPEGSPTRDRSPEPPLLTGLLYSGADMIRRKLVGNNSESPDRSSRIPARNKILLSRQEKRALRSLRLMEKVESIGLENIMHASSNYHPVGISPLAVGSVRTRTASPMTQLTSLKNISQQHRRSDDPYAVDKETIKAVLNKGLSHESLLSDITTDGSTTSSITRLDDSDSTLNNQKPPFEASSQISIGTTNRNEKTPQKVKQMQRQKSRRSLMNGGGGQRPDLGTVGPGTTKKNSNNSHSKSTHSTKLIQELDSDDDDRSSIASVAPQQSYTQSFVGSISSLFFGRKGGLL